MMSSMKPEPLDTVQRAIAQRIDEKAHVISEGLGRWRPKEILAEINVTVPHEGNADDDRFAEKYAEWRSQHPL
jgi:hypothetical protein